MTTIYAAAVRNYEAAAAVLAALQSNRLDLMAEVATAMVGRPKLVLSGGYNTVTPAFGACLPTGTRCDILPGSEDVQAIELRSSGLQWMTLEAPLPQEGAARKCFIECHATGEVPLVADVFLRSFDASGEARDSGHVEWRIQSDSTSLCALELPALAEDAAGRRVIIHLRQPAQRLVLGGLALTLV